MERLFALSSVLVAPFWLLMLLAPRWRWTERLVRSPAIVVGPVVIYAILAGPELLRLLPVLASPELPTIAALLATPEGATLAWAHFLAFDLFVARFIFFDAKTMELPAWVLSPILLLTLLFGPLGLGIYLGLRAIGIVRLRAFATAVWEGSRPLAWLAIGSGALLAASLLLQVVDPRLVLGASTWLKPAKFAAAILVTAPMLAWILGQVMRTRGVRVAEWLMTATVVLELVIISVQAARGVPSHFNNTTLPDFVLFQIMGGAIAIFWLSQVFVAYRTFRTRFATPARTWAIRLGLGATLLGGALGGLMTRPTAAQMASLEAGAPTPAIGAHAVGVPDGGRGMAITRWSTEGGDLRVPHFIGLHGLQVLSLVGWMAERRRRRRGKARPVIAAGLTWIGLLGVTTWQALRGQPLLAPDVVTLAAAAAVALATVLVLTWPRAHGSRTKAPLDARSDGFARAGFRGSFAP